MRQLSHNLSIAEKAAGNGSQSRPGADAELKALPAAQREVEALNARVSWPLSMCFSASTTLHQYTSISRHKLLFGTWKPMFAGALAASV